MIFKIFLIFSYSGTDISAAQRTVIAGAVAKRLLVTSRNVARVVAHTSRPVAKNELFAGDTKVVRTSHNVPFRVGIANTKNPQVVSSISKLLVRSISDAKQSNKIPGHLPDHLVDYIIKNYISPENITSLWADYGRRFAMTSAEGEIVGTALVGSSPDTILYLDRLTHNVSSEEYPDFKPKDYHQIMNFCVKHELRRLGVGGLLINSIDKDYGDEFAGKGLWMRADPPWHNKLTGIGFKHDRSMDSFLDENTEKTLDMSHSDYNKKYDCTCEHPHPENPANLSLRDEKLVTQKLQYLSFTYDFASRYILPK